MVCSELNIATDFYSCTCTSLTSNCLVITYKCRFLVNVYECLEVSECPYRCACTCSMCNVHVQYVIYIVDVIRTIITHFLLVGHRRRQAPRSLRELPRQQADAHSQGLTGRQLSHRDDRAHQPRQQPVRGVAQHARLRRPRQEHQN